MKIKTVEVNGTTYGVVSDGKPVFVEDDGSEVAIDVANTKATISRLNGEAKGHRERAEKAEAALKVFEGLDPAAAREAVAKLANIDAKKLIDAGEVERVRSDISKVYDEKLSAAEKRALAAEEAMSNALIGGAFSGSKYIQDKLAVPADMIQATFGKAFKVEDGKVVAYGPDGSKLVSRANPGEFASFDEAMSLLVGAYPFKDHILKGVGHSGGGAKPGAGSPGAKVMSRAEFGKLDGAAQMAKVREGFTVAD